jgi:hypothetical protein
MALQIVKIALLKAAFCQSMESGQETRGPGRDILPFLHDRSAGVLANRCLLNNPAFEFKGIPSSPEGMGVDGFCV